jgi:multiple sugar transport system substrate-binding protein
MKKSVFQTVLVVVFIVMAVGGAIYFANPPKDDDALTPGGITGTVTIWGTYPATSGLSELWDNFKKSTNGAVSVEYVAFDPRTFDREIVEALASGRGPDVLLLPDDLVLRHSDKILPMGYTPQFGQREFMSSFIQAAEIYLRSDGIIAFPFAVDPMVMYWNRDLFSNASVAEPPKYWDEFLLLTPKLTKTDRSLKITQSAVAFGEYENVKNAKSILSMFFIQAGSPIVATRNDVPTTLLVKTEGGGRNLGIESVMRYFMDFANPLKTTYTWNRARANSEDEFLAGNLAIYFDYASSYERIRQKNPNLNFGVAMVPQVRDAKTQLTIARLHGLSVMKSSKQQALAFASLPLLLKQETASGFAEVYDLPPVRRDLLAKPPSDAQKAVAYDSALRSRTWLDPKPEETEKAFRDAVESISSGRTDEKSAVTNLESRIQSLVSEYFK